MNLNPLQTLSNLAKLDSALNAGNSSNPKHFNASLPVLLKVLAQSKNGEYLLQLGRSQIATNSAIKLEIGKSYWANMQKNEANQIILSNLIKNPKIMENLQNSPLKFSLSDLAELQKNPKDFINELKEFLLKELALCENKKDFSELSKSLLCLSQGVLSLVISDENKEHLLQMTTKKSRKQEVHFYGIFPSLGPIKGIFSVLSNFSQMPKSKKINSKDSSDSNLLAQFWVMSEKIATLLKKHKSDLGIICDFCVYVDSEVAPLFELENHLLDIKT
ncbi:hypothetical protein [Helicobacter sp. T3_23-1059]